LALARRRCWSLIFSFFALSNSLNFSRRAVSCWILASTRSSSCWLSFWMVFPCSLYLTVKSRTSCSRFVALVTAIPAQAVGSISTSSSFVRAISPSLCVIPEMFLRKTRTTCSPVMVAIVSSLSRASVSEESPCVRR
jgi:hypothetical protein